MEKAFYNHVKPATTNAISQFKTPMISLKPENLSPHHKRLIHTSLHKKKIQPLFPRLIARLLT